MAAGRPEQHEAHQDGNSRTMVFGVAPLISYISRYMTLAPGDVMSTGTPSGVGLGQKPPVYPRPGDFIDVHIERLGCQRQRVVAAIWDTSPSGG
jgi:2,4-diketo-3-deoxy-L-fuconate hydrolase